MSLIDINEQTNESTKRIVSNKQYKSMGKLSIETPERGASAIEKTFAMENPTGAINPIKKDSQARERQFKNIENAHQELKNAEKSLNRSKTNPKTRLYENKSVATAAQTGTFLRTEVEKTNDKTEIINVPAISNEAMQMINALMHTQNHIVEQLTDAFDKRFEKFDDIIIDLINSKTENERLKQKIDNLTRENYRYKKEVESYKPIFSGVFIKKEIDKTKF